MSNKQPEFYCDIPVYLEAKHPKFYKLVTQTCSEAMMRGAKGAAGITVIIPSDEFLKTIEKKVMGSTEADFTAGVDMIQACIIRAALNSNSDWMQQKEDLVNFIRQKVEVDSVAGKQVKLKGGVVVEKDDQFKAAAKFDGEGKPKRVKHFVWVMKSGEMPINGKPAEFKMVKRPAAAQKGKDGSYQLEQEQIADARHLLAVATENAYVSDRLNKIMGSNMVRLGGHEYKDLPRNIFVEQILSYVNYNENYNQDENYSLIIPQISFGLADFFILVDPHRSKKNAKVGPQLINDDKLSNWLKLRTPFDYSKVAANVMKCLESKKEAAAPSCCFYNDKDRLITAINKLRTQILLTARPADILKKIHEAYDNLEKNNKIGDCENVFPADLHNHFKENPGYKVMIDEVRFTAYVSECLMNRRGFNVADFSNLINTIGSIMYNGNAADRKAGLKLLDTRLIANSVDMPQHMAAVRAFVNSTAFLYIALSPADFEKFKKLKVDNPSLDGSTMTAVYGPAVLEHKRLVADSQPADDNFKQQLAKILENPDLVAADQLEAIKKLAA